MISHAKYGISKPASIIASLAYFVCVCVLPFCFSQLTTLLANTVHCSEQGICAMLLARSLRSIADGGPKQLRASIPCRQNLRTHCGLSLRPSARPLAALASG